MKTESLSTEPKLQPPGAGLPLKQRLFLRYWLGPVVSKRAIPEETRELYEGLTRKLIEKISQIPTEKRAIRVLVDPIEGLEDSSRYWSLNGVMEHLLYVSRGIEAVVLSLSAGKIPNSKADVAKAKPTQPNRDFLSEFTDYAPDLMKRLDEKLTQPGVNFNSGLRFRHPWLGKLTAPQWYWVLSSHQGIHYLQAKEIIAKLE